MCDDCFQLSLYKTNNGEVFISNCGYKYKLVYNNIMLIHGYESYLKFFRNIEECHFVVKDDPDQNSRTVKFSTNTALTIFCFSPLEIAELHYLLQSALIEAKVYV
ncbi:MAG: DUF6686 family protein [Bacteroidota bacterium]